MGKSQIGRAVVDLIEAWQDAKDKEWILRPVSYALYHTWKKWDIKEKNRGE